MREAYAPDFLIITVNCKLIISNIRGYEYFITIDKVVRGPKFARDGNHDQHRRMKKACKDFLGKENGASEGNRTPDL